MEKILKFLSKLTFKEREDISRLLIKVRSGNINGLDIKKLKGYKDLFRLRKGNFRVVYKKNSDEFEVLKVYKRDDNTYKDL